ncbi:DUF2808 domain-containing protein [Lyngbya aestuarii]|uniref:DUF2808 domain-containing protein n=1 Tax=Lyngbya aestuarii TaxID=118322 RepID=UPI00403D7261
MQFFTVKRFTLIISVSIWGIAIPSMMALELPDGTIWFEKSPRLLEVTTTYKQIYLRGATYYFTLKLPEDAGEPLGRVVINQRQGFDDIRFNLEDTLAFLETPQNRGQSLTLKEITQEPEMEGISVTFDKPVAPGETITIGLRPLRNPTTSGFYTFGVTAFPAGEQAEGIYLGSRNLYFTDSDGDAVSGY